MADSIRLSNGLEISLAQENGYASSMEDVAEKGLAPIRRSKEMPLAAGGTLHTESYLPFGAEKAVILVHGYTESAEKLKEMVWYFVQAGFCVFTYDQRGHGRSVRDVDDLTLTHVDHFEDYVSDLEELLLRVVLPETKGMPLCLFGHSMGGAVVSHFIVEHPTTIRKAVLSSPMIAPATGSFPPWAVRVLTALFCMIGKGRDRAFIAGPYDPEKETFEKSCATSPARFEYYKNKRMAKDYLQNCAPSYRWVHESVVQTSGLFDRKRVSGVTTNVLLCQAGKDDLVAPVPQEDFIRALPSAKLIRYDEAKHEIYNSADAVMKQYVKDVLEFLTAE